MYSVCMYSNVVGGRDADLPYKKNIFFLSHTFRLLRNIEPKIRFQDPCYS